VIHPINTDTFFGGSLPEFDTNLRVPTLSENCNQKVQCDMHYELDWSFRLRTSISCETAAQKDPCFSTSACLCDTGYYRISKLMPKPKEDDSYDGFAEILQEFKMNSSPPQIMEQ